MTPHLAGQLISSMPLLVLAFLFLLDPDAVVGYVIHAHRSLAGYAGRPRPVTAHARAFLRCLGAVLAVSTILIATT